MKKLRFILLSAVLAAVFGFSFIGCSNYSSNGGSSKHGMTIKLKASGTTYTYYADYAADDKFDRKSLPEMIVFNSDGNKIEDGSVSITHEDARKYTLIINDEINRKVKFKTSEPYEFTSSVNNSEKGSKEIEELTINGQKYDLEVNNI